jgi:hypothetical protein
MNNIDGTDTQGLVADNYTFIKLLANRDAIIDII